MKHIKITCTVVAFFLLLAYGCGNASNETNTTTADTTATADTIKSDPNTFSQPH